MNDNPNDMTTSTTSLVMRLLRWLVLAALLVVLVFLSLWLGSILFSWVIVPAFVERHIRELGRLLGWPNDIVWLVSVPLAVASSVLVAWVFRRNRRRRWAAIGGLVAMAVVYFGLHAWLSRNHLYDPKGQPLFYWGLTPWGEIHKQAEPGLSPYTHKPLRPASPEYLALIRARLREPLQPANPATNDWFDANMGWPLLWYIRNPQGELEFYKRPAIHPRYRVELQEVTVELRGEWEQEQARMAADAAAHDARELEEKRQEAVARAAEQQRLLQIEQARVEAERIRAESALREQAATAARAREEQTRRDVEAKAAQARQDVEAKEAKARRIAEATARYETALAERSSQEREAAESRHRQDILDRRAREATAEVIALDWLLPGEMLRQICPKLNVESFQANVFEEDYAGRRFRYSGRVARLQKDTRLATFESLTVGEIHFIVQATLQPETVGQLRAGREASVAGTVVALRFVAGITNINGLRGRLCILELGNATGYYRESVAAQPTKTVARKTSSGEPLFVPMSSFSGNTPLQAGFGFTVENSVRLVFTPLRLLGRHTDSGHDRAVVVQTPSYPSPGIFSAPPMPAFPVVQMARPMATGPTQVRVVQPAGVQPPFVRLPPVNYPPQNRQVRPSGERRAR